MERQHPSKEVPDMVEGSGDPAGAASNGWRRAAWAAYAPCTWALVFAVVHLYWGLGVPWDSRPAVTVRQHRAVRDRPVGHPAVRDRRVVGASAGVAVGRKVAAMDASECRVGRLRFVRRARPARRRRRRDHSAGPAHGEVNTRRPLQSVPLRAVLVARRNPVRRDGMALHAWDSTIGVPRDGCRWSTT